MPLEQERAERERLRGGPINALARFEHALAIVEEALDRAVDPKPGRNLRQPLSNFLEGASRNAGLAAACLVHVLLRRLEAGPAAIEPIGLVRLSPARPRTPGRAWCAKPPSSPRPRPR